MLGLLWKLHWIHIQFCQEAIRNQHQVSMCWSPQEQGWAAQHSAVLATFLAFVLLQCNQGIPPGQMCGIKETPNCTRFICFLQEDLNLNRKSLSTTFWSKLEASLEHVMHTNACNWDDQNMAKLTQEWYVPLKNKLVILTTEWLP